MRNCSLARFTALAAFATTLGAQTAATNTPPVLQAFKIERALDISKISTSLTPSIPPAAAAGFLAGALELRESMSFDPANQVLVLSAFTVQAGAPLPTPPSPAMTAATFSTAIINIDKVYSALTPRPAVMLVGTVVSNAPASPYGNLAGAPVAISVGYTMDTPPKITDTTLLIAGTAVEYSASAAGTLTFVQPPAPPATSNAPKIVISSPTSVYQKIADLDASMTTSANPPLTFAWTVISGNADIARANSAQALAYLNGGFGSYMFKLVVTDAKGNTSSQTVTINLY